MTHTLHLTAAADTETPAFFPMQAHCNDDAPEPDDARAETCAGRPITAAEKDALFRQLVTEYGRALHYFVLRRVGNETEAADIAQQAFVEASLGLTTFRGEAGVSTWIFGIAMNLVRNHLNRSPQRRRVFESADVLEDIEAPDTDPCDILARKQAVRVLADAVGKLPARMSEALILVSVDGASYEEAAEQLGVPVGTVRSRISRARAAIRGCMRDAGCEAAA